MLTAPQVKAAPTRGGVVCISRRFLLFYLNLKQAFALMWHRARQIDRKLRLVDQTYVLMSRCSKGHIAYEMSLSFYQKGEYRVECVFLPGKPKISSVNCILITEMKYSFHITFPELASMQSTMLPQAVVCNADTPIPAR
uniref:Putative secreted protein n=1 Tax=Anopheles darlingi TaxID=43151 RepID=A0A2M4DC13_ANODA